LTHLGFVTVPFHAQVAYNASLFFAHGLSSAVEGRFGGPMRAPGHDDLLRIASQLATFNNHPNPNELHAKNVLQSWPSMPQSDATEFYALCTVAQLRVSFGGLASCRTP
jgi:hypothetical protein